jgi:hypothetical protein
LLKKDLLLKDSPKKKIGEVFELIKILDKTSCFPLKNLKISDNLKFIKLIGKLFFDLNPKPNRLKFWSTYFDLNLTFNNVDSILGFELIKKQRLEFLFKS